jgi:hypothetical protein
MFEAKTDAENSYTDTSKPREAVKESELMGSRESNPPLSRSPKTPKSLPREFAIDTPFVPFVHRSLTRTVWQSDEVIPEERDDLERK